MSKLGISALCDWAALILRQKTSGTPSEEELVKAINEVSNIQEYLKNPLTEDEKDQIKKILEARLLISMDVGVKIVDQNTYKPWLAHRKAEIEEYYWDRYKSYLLEAKHWADNVVSTLDKDGDEILDMMGDPQDARGWKRKGLVLGDIQSGKTSTYLALINKAADAGYKLIILLSGTLEALRKQTQERVDEGFVGLNSRNALDKDIEKKYVGVGLFDKRRTAFPLTDIISDFDVKKLQAHNFNAKSLNEPIIFVVKKNTTVLKNLLAWISNSYKDTASDSITAPLLLIDDEADNASVNTKKPELDPAAVNLAIRKILNLFQRSTYVAVTATPFANIFINPDDDKETIKDLFPSDFIYSLSPPDNYIGSGSIFGENARLADSIESINDADAVFSSSEKSNHTVISLPGSLQKSIGYFLLCNVVRDCRGITNDHRSMLINVSPYTLPQETTYDLVDVYVDRLQKDIKAYSKLDSSSALKNKSIAFLNDIWTSTGLDLKTGKEYEEILPLMTESTLPVKVTMVNTKTKSRGLQRLDYKPYEDNGYRIIVVGGNSLSRGITLEGLCVSYFHRESKMYDTLLQMGRWFGYRPGYDDIFRIWMTERTIEWFEFINKACDELRSEILYMNKLDQTPSEFGLKVLEHPDTLMITAANKMRTAKPLERWISLSGKLVETPWLMTSTIEYNNKHTISFLQQIRADFVASDAEGRLFSKVPSERIADFIKDFASHPGHLVFGAREIGSYIEKNKHGLGDWFIYVPNGGDDEIVDYAGFKIKRTMRRMLIQHGCIRVSGNNSRVGSIGTVGIILPKPKQAAAYEAYKEYLISKSEFRADKKLRVPDHIYLRYTEQPILIVYIMMCNPQQTDQKSYLSLKGKTIIGLGLGFPRTQANEEKIRYKMNIVEQTSLMPTAIEPDLDGDEDDEN